MRVAIVGAGVAGLACGEALLAQGIEVQWFDKSRASAGRASAKRAFGGHIDLGAQYFTARHPAFRQQVDDWQQQGLVEHWDPQLYCFVDGQLQASPDDTRRYVGTPAMHSPWRSHTLADKLLLSCRIEQLQYRHGWQLQSDDGRQFSGFDALVLALPPAQAAALLSLDPVLQQQIPDDILLPCQAVALQLNQPMAHPAEGIFVKEGPLSWVARQDSKPGRTSPKQQWVLHFTPEFSQQQRDASSQFLIDCAADALSTLFQQPVQLGASVHHRWLYAIVDASKPAPGILTSARFPAVVAGDWSLGGRVENAWLAGQQAAKAVLHV